MAPHVLGVGYSYDEYGITAAEWRKYGIEFDYVDDIGQAAAMLSFKEYICVAICTDIIPQEDLDALRKVRPVPIVVVPPSYSEAQRYACEYCHSYYATRKSNVKYCPYPNPNHKGESCRKIAPKILYWSRSKMLKEYRKACESYERWIKRTKADDDKAYDYIKLLKVDIIAEFEEEEKEKGEVWRKLMDKVKDEITFLFSSGIIMPDRV